MSAAFPEIAELKLIICGPNIFGPLFDKISRVLEHSTPEKKNRPPGGLPTFKALETPLAPALKGHFEL